MQDKHRKRYGTKNMQERGVSREWEERGQPAVMGIGGWAGGEAERGQGATAKGGGESG